MRVFRHAVCWVALLLILGGGCSSASDEADESRGTPESAQQGEQYGAGQDGVDADSGTSGETDTDGSGSAESGSPSAGGSGSGMGDESPGVVKVDGREDRPGSAAGKPDAPSAEGKAPNGVDWALWVWDSDKGKCGQIELTKPATATTGGGSTGTSECGWDLRIDQHFASGSGTSFPPTRAVYGPVLAEATRVVVVERNGKEVEAAIVHHSSDNIGYYVGFPSTYEPLLKAQAFDSRGQLLAEYINSREEEDALASLKPPSR